MQWFLPSSVWLHRYAGSGMGGKNLMNQYVRLYNPYKVTNTNINIISCMKNPISLRQMSHGWIKMLKSSVYSKKKEEKQEHFNREMII